MSKERLLTDEEQKHKISQAYTELKPVNLQEWLEAQDVKTAEMVRTEIVGWLDKRNLTKNHPNCFMITLEDWEALKQGRMPE